MDKATHVSKLQNRVLYGSLQLTGYGPVAGGGDAVKLAREKLETAVKGYLSQNPTIDLDADEEMEAIDKFGSTHLTYTLMTGLLLCEDSEKKFPIDMIDKTSSCAGERHQLYKKFSCKLADLCMGGRSIPLGLLLVLGSSPTYKVAGNIIVAARKEQWDKGGR